MRRVGADAQVDARLDRGEERHHRRLRPGAARHDGLEADRLLAGEAVEERRGAAGVAVAAHVRRSDAVDQHEDDVGLRRRGVGGACDGEGRRNGQKRTSLHSHLLLGTTTNALLRAPRESG